MKKKVMVIRNEDRLFRKLFNRLGSSRLRCLQTELDDSPPLLRRKPFHTFREADRNIKFNNLCHSKSFRGVSSFLTNVNAPTTPIHTDNGTESVNLSFLRSALHTAHDRIHIFCSR